MEQETAALMTGLPNAVVPRPPKRYFELGRVVRWVRRLCKLPPGDDRDASGPLPLGGFLGGFDATGFTSFGAQLGRSLVRDRDE